MFLIEDSPSGFWPEGGRRYLRFLIGVIFVIHIGPRNGADMTFLGAQ